MASGGNMLRRQSGFTMIELVMAIVILGVLAAIALPKFIDFKSEAQNASARGIASSIVSTASMLHTQYNVKGSAYVLGTTGGDQLQVIANANVSGGPLVEVSNPGLAVTSNASALVTLVVNDVPYTMTITLNDTLGPQASYNF